MSETGLKFQVGQKMVNRKRSEVRSEVREYSEVERSSSRSEIRIDGGQVAESLGIVVWWGLAVAEGPRSNRMPPVSQLTPQEVDMKQRVIG